jgi:U3 small nucleolar RNA-associated protein 25
MLAGNIDDAFRIGLQVGRKTTRLFSDFYSSDIIIASPLGVKLAIAKAAGGDGEKPGASDFLSSIELCVVDGATALLQQNWEHVEDIGEALNQRPEALRSATDMSRVRFTDLDGVSRHLRQTVLLAAQPDADLTAWMRTHCANHRGWVSLQATYAGAVTRVRPVVRQVFQRVPAPTITAIAAARLAFFMRVVLPRMQAAATGTGTMQTHTVIIASSSLEYVQLRNAFDSEDIEFAPISEHSDSKDVSRARDLLHTGDAPILLTTERWCYFNRTRLRGTRHLVFYGPPRLPSTYIDALNTLDESMRNGDGVSCLCLFNRLEGVALERLVGSSRCTTMLAPATPSAADSSTSSAALQRMRRQSRRDDGKPSQHHVSTFVFVND